MRDHSLLRMPLSRGLVFQGNMNRRLKTMEDRRPTNKEADVCDGRESVSALTDDERSEEEKR